MANLPEELDRVTSINGGLYRNRRVKKVNVLNYYCYSNIGVYFNMAQNLPRFLRPLLRIGSIAFLAGVVTVIMSTTIHLSREDPANHLLVYAEYARDDSWIAVHIGQFASGIMVFAGVALYLLLVRSESRTAYVLVWIGFAVAILSASTLAILQAVDGIALKMAVDSWIAAPAEEKAITFRVAEGIRFI